MTSTARVQCRGTTYELRLSSTGDALQLTLQQCDGGFSWGGSFNARCAPRHLPTPAALAHAGCSRADVEEITHKTGSFKKFDVFVNMLRGALLQREEGLHIDVLTYADLLALKSRKSGNAEPTAAARDPATVAGNTKRYLILTYASRFDRQPHASAPSDE